MHDKAMLFTVYPSSQTLSVRDGTVALCAVKNGDNTYSVVGHYGENITVLLRSGEAINADGIVELTSRSELISSCAYAKGWQVGSGYDATVYSGGFLSKTTVSEGGDMVISSGGKARWTYVNGGTISVKTGGTANIVEVSSLGNERGYLDVSSGGVVNSAVVGIGGSMTVREGGSAYYITENGGYVGFYDGVVVSFSEKRVNNIILSSGNSATAHESTLFSSATIGYGAHLGLIGGSAKETIIQEGGNLTAMGYSGFRGYARDTKISGGTLACESGGYCAETNIYAGQMQIYSGGSGGGIYISSGGTLDVHESCRAYNIDLFHGGTLNIFSGGKVSNIDIMSEASVWAQGNATYDYTVIKSGGSFYAGNADVILETIRLSSGGELALNNIGQTPYPNGRAEDLHILSGASTMIWNSIITDMMIYSGGTVTMSHGKASGNIIVNPGATFQIAGNASVTILNTRWRGTIDYTQTAEGPYISYADPDFTVFLGNENVGITEYGKSINNTVLQNGINAYIGSGGTMSITHIEDGCSMFVEANGRATSVTVSSGGTLVISSAGSAVSVTSLTGAIIDIKAGGYISYE